MGRTAALIGDDRNHPAHRRLPVGIGVFGNQNLAIPDGTEFGNVSNNTDRSCANLLADCLSGYQRRPCRAFDPVDICRGRSRFSRMNSLRPCLQHIQRTRDPILSPLDVHRHGTFRELRIVLLNQAPAAEFWRAIKKGILTFSSVEVRNYEQSPCFHRVFER